MKTCSETTSNEMCHRKIEYLSWDVTSEHIYASKTLDSMTCSKGEGFLNIPTALKMWVSSASYKDIKKDNLPDNTGRFIDTNPYTGNFVDLYNTLPAAITSEFSSECFVAPEDNCSPLLFKDGFLRAPIPVIPYVVDTYIDTDKVLDINLEMPSIVMPNIAIPNLSTPDIIVPSITIPDIIVPNQILDIEVPDIPMGTFTIDIGDIDIGTITIPDIEIKMVEDVKVSIKRGFDLKGYVERGHKHQEKCTPVKLAYTSDGAGAIYVVSNDDSDVLSGNIDAIERIFDIRYPGGPNTDICNIHIENVNSSVVLGVAVTDTASAYIQNNVLYIPNPTTLPKYPDSLSVLACNGSELMWLPVGSCN